MLCLMEKKFENLHSLRSSWGKSLYVCIAMTNLDSIFRTRDIALLTKVCIVRRLWFF